MGKQLGFIRMVRLLCCALGMARDCNSFIREWPLPEASQPSQSDICPLMCATMALRMVGLCVRLLPRAAMHLAAVEIAGPDVVGAAAQAPLGRNGD
jgi:hypothetical protein